MSIRIINADVMEGLSQLDDESVNCVVTSPPYWGLRDYGVDGQIGLEPTPDAFVAKMVEVFREVRRVLRPDGTLWLNLGDSYCNTDKWGGGGAGKNGKQTVAPDGSVPSWAVRRKRDHIEGIKPKDLVGIPWMTAFALRADGWWLRQEIIWAKCLSGGAIVYAMTQKGEMPMMVKDLVRLDPTTVKLWDGQKWNQCLEWHKVDGDPERKAKSLKARRARYLGTDDVPVEGDIEFELRSGERIGCTREHRWPTQRGLLTAEELAVGDVIASAQLPEPAGVRRPRALDDDTVGWFVGLYIAEGSRSGDTIQIAGHKDEAERFQRLCALAEMFDGTCAVHLTHGNAATINLHGPILNAIIDTYVSGRIAKDKRLNVRGWMRSNAFLKAVLNGYLSGDGSDNNGRWKIGFCENDGLASDLRVICARIGASLRLRRHQHQFQGREYPGWLGSLYFDPARRKRPDTEVVAIRQSRARCFYDIVLEDEPHLFALGSGVLTHNSNPMPESIQDRCTKAHEHLFLLAKSERYFFDASAIREEGAGRLDRWPGGAGRLGAQGWKAEPLAEAGGRNKRSVWTIATQPYSDAHFATFPEELPEICIKAGCPVGGIVLDPFGGAGTTGLVADKLGRDAILIELNPEYAAMAERRIEGDCPLFAEVHLGPEEQMSLV